MMTLEEIRVLYAEQDKNPDTTNAQKAANAFRLHLYECLSRSKAPYEPRPALDVIIDRLTTGATYTPNSLLEK